MKISKHFTTAPVLPLDLKVAPPRGFPRMPELERLELSTRVSRSIRNAKIKATADQFFRDRSEGPTFPEGIQFQFRWHGDAAASVLWVVVRDGTTIPRALTLLLTRQDAATEGRMIDVAPTSIARMSAMPPDIYDHIRSAPDPLAVHFLLDDDAVNDSHLFAVVPIVSEAFFELFGMTEKLAGFKAEHKLIYAVANADDKDLPEPSSIYYPPTVADLYQQMRASINEKPDGFRIVYTLADGKELALDWQRRGVASGTAAFFFPEPDRPKMVAVMALLGKIDRTEDANAIDLLKKFAAVGGIPQTKYEAAKLENQPTLLLCFPNLERGNYSPAHVYAQMFAAAFFNHSGEGFAEETAAA
jgi:hypothetical protein